MKNRKEILGELLLFEKKLEDLVVELNNFPWDSERELIVLTRADLSRVLERLANHELNAQEVEAWANTIEGRDDIGFKKGYENLIVEVVFELANPLLTEELTADRVKTILTNLN